MQRSTPSRVVAALAVIGFVTAVARAQQSRDAASPEAIKPYTVHVSGWVLEDLEDRLARTRFSDHIAGSGWDYGTDLAFLKELVEYWRTSYDWRQHERALNRFDHFVTEIDGLDVHFIHHRSPEPGALPLVITHGWPGSVTEFVKVIEPLTNPVAHGGRAEDAFHVVCPSMPGYGFSERPTEPGMSVGRVGEVVATLMDRLGYERYGAQGGDWGAAVTAWLGLNDADHVAGIHLNFAAVGPPAGAADPFEGVSPAERRRYEQRRDELALHRAYAQIQGTRPQTLGYALNDSPAGLASWIVDKFRIWSDCGGDVESSFSKDELLTNITVYWATGTINSSMRLYFETRGDPRPRRYVEVPTGVALFPKELIVPPRKWVEARYNLVHWTEMPRGGHFATLEEPELYVEDVRAFFRGLR
jgi:pimeloyl-ACP methyl ester carboxylesterase